MEDFVINVAEIEEWQMTKNIIELDNLFGKARRTVISGGTVVLIRKNRDGSADKFDQLTTEEDLVSYKQHVYKYLI